VLLTDVLLLILSFNQVVEKHSALLEVEGEDQIPIDANHIDMCKFAGRDDEVYEKLFKRVGRMVKGKCVEVNTGRT